MTKICDYCGKVFNCDDYKVDLCDECKEKEFYTVENMIAYLDHYDLTDVYYNEMQASIYNENALIEFINEDRDHFMDWCINTAYWDKIHELKKLGIINV